MLKLENKDFLIEIAPLILFLTSISGVYWSWWLNRKWGTRIRHEQSPRTHTWNTCFMSCFGFCRQQTGMSMVLLTPMHVRTKIEFFILNRNIGSYIAIHSWFSVHWIFEMLVFSLKHIPLNCIFCLKFGVQMVLHCSSQNISQLDLIFRVWELFIWNYISRLESHLNFEVGLRSCSFIHFLPLDIGISRVSIQWFPANLTSVVLVDEIVPSYLSRLLFPFWIFWHFHNP